RKDDELGVPGERIAAGLDHVDIDDVRHADGLFPHRVVQAQQVESAQVEPLTELEAGPFPQDQPGPPSVNLFPRPVEEGLQAASRGVRSQT
ncbi:hypothetical protein ACQ7B2_12685, partial [Escherichia coli]